MYQLPKGADHKIKNDKEKTFLMGVINDQVLLGTGFECINIAYKDIRERPKAICVSKENNKTIACIIQGLFPAVTLFNDGKQFGKQGFVPNIENTSNILESDSKLDEQELPTEEETSEDIEKEYIPETVSDPEPEIKDETTFETKDGGEISDSVSTEPEESPDPISSELDEASISFDKIKDIVEKPKKKKRGRPPKNKTVNSDS